VDTLIFTWLQENKGKIFASPRNDVFGARTEDFEIVNIRPDRVSIRFIGAANTPLSLIFSMFDRVLDCLRENQGNPVRIGAKVNPPYENNTLEQAIWRQPYPAGLNNSYKAAPHVCDILVLAGLAEYIKITNPLTGRNVQSVRLLNKTIIDD
jgi:hypothetical protein